MYREREGAGTGIQQAFNRFERLTRNDVHSLNLMTSAITVNSLGEVSYHKDHPLHGRQVPTELSPLGYLRARFKDQHRRKWRLPVHRLVLLCFAGLPSEERFESDHVNAIRTDNRLENLRWVNRRENLPKRHAWSPKAVLTQNQVEEIRERYSAGGVSLGALARELGVSHAVIKNRLLHDYSRPNPGETKLEAVRSRVLELRAKGLSMRAIAQQLGVGRKTVSRALKLWAGVTTSPTEK